MTEKKKKMKKSVHANIEAPKIQKAKMKKKNSYANTKKANLSNQISDSEKFSLSRCQQKKKKSVPPHHTCKGKSVVESSQMDIVASQLWAMKEYGVKESWTQLFTIQHRGLLSAKPRYMFADGDVLLRCKIYKWNIGTVFMTSKGPFGGLWRGVDDFQDGIVFVESLISPKSLI